MNQGRPSTRSAAKKTSVEEEKKELSSTIIEKIAVNQLGVQ
jgi:hypothetical protein